MGAKHHFPSSSNPSPQNSRYTVSPGGISHHQYHPAFSFRYYDRCKSDFKFNLFKGDDLVKFADDIKALSQLTWGDVAKSGNRFRFHRVDWEKTAYKQGFKHLEGFSDYQQHKGEPAYQFSSLKECRVFGFFNKIITGNRCTCTFEIVYVDRHHKICPLD